MSIIDWMKNLLRPAPVPEPPVAIYGEPGTLTEAIDAIFVKLKPHEIEIFKNGDVGFLSGMHLRNTLGLWNRESKLVQHFITKYGICHADDISGLILQGLTRKVNGKFFNPYTEVVKYKTHWKSAGFDPATMGPLK